jgi:allophanate hydrolase
MSLPGEEWLLPVSAVGTLVLALPTPEAVGPVALDDGREVLGVTGAVTGRERDISDPYGWRAFRRGDE